MQTFKSRIEALEAAGQGDAIKVVCLLDGETQAEALARAGLQPDARSVVWCTPLDEML
jgi:hypothetical protein